MTTINDLVSGVLNRIDSIPSTITGSPMIWSLLDDARKDVQNITGDSISSGAVSEKYQSVISNLGAAYVLSRMTGIGVDFDYKLGNFSVSKGKAGNSNAQQLEFLVNQANLSMKFIGTKIPFKATFL